MGAGLFLASGCSKEDLQMSEEILQQGGGGYGRTEEEIARDARLFADNFFTKPEFEMVEVLANIIIPADDESGSAVDAGVPEFIEFMMKDRPQYQLVTRGGLMWLNNYCNSHFGKDFLECNETEQMEIIEEIAWPDDAETDMQYGVRFFNRMRDLTATGFFTSEMGLEYLDYLGNHPNFWDGVPEEVLHKHGMEYDQKTLEECIKEEDRGRIAEWDQEGNLIG